MHLIFKLRYRTLVSSMTEFEIVHENGYAAQLKVIKSDLPPTPWLLETKNKIKMGEIVFHIAVVTENGFDILSFDDLINDNANNFEELPDFSIISPMIYPAFNILRESHEYELNLFLDRLEKLKLPAIFGLTYNPSRDPDFYLEEILVLNPSFIVLRIDNIDRINIRKLLSLVINTRERVPRNMALYLAGGVPIGQISLFMALGIDIFDDGAAYRLTSKRKLMRDGFIRKSNLGVDLLNQNIKALLKDFNASCESLKENTIWTRIGRDMHAEPRAATMVTIFNHEFLPKLNLNKFSSFMKSKIYFTGDEGLHHPDIVRYRNQVLQNYRIGYGIKVVILLPCSARKPYRNSRSHAAFIRSIGSASRKKRYLVEVWSLTSPLGVVPRPLETLYPAGFYDIPVSGNWSEEEVRITGTMLKTMLSELPEDIVVISHVSQDYKKMVDFTDFELISTGYDSPTTSHERLEKLEDAIKDAVSDLDINIPRVKMKKLEIEAQQEIPHQLRYVHGLDATINLEGIKIIGRPPRPVQVQKDKQHWITWDSLFGEVRLTPNAASQIARTSKNWVILDFDENTKLTGSTVYAVGIKDASPLISPNDEVLLFDEDKSHLLGVGIALISGSTMNQIRSGPCIKIRKKGRFEV